MIVVVLCPEPLYVVLMLLAAGRPPLLETVVRIAIDGVLAWSLYRGDHWARIYVPASLLVAGAAGILIALSRPGGLHRVSLLATSLLHVAAALILWVSPSVGAYFAKRQGSKSSLLELERRDDP